MKRKRKAALPSLSLSSDTKKGIWGIIFVFFAVFFAFSHFHLTGKVGEGVSKVLTLLFGGGSWLIIILFFLQGLILFFSKRPSPYLSTIIGGILLLISFFSILELISENLGGYFGRILASLPKELLGVAGSWIFFITLFLISISILFNISIFSIFKRREREDKEDERSHLLKEGEADLKIKEISPIKEAKEQIKLTTSKILKEPKKRFKYKTLPINLLEKEKNQAVAGNLRANAQIIKRTFQNFGIDVEMGEINIGPAVTQYTLKPAEGIKLSKILSLQNDLALSLASHPIRVEAPIPGKSLVGIEVPNRKRAEVRLANLLSCPEFLSLPPMGFALGRDVRGRPYFSDLSSMPHLLVAGATGSGKTVFLNSLILSLLWRNNPQNLRFILIDPKRVEFTFYAPLPHLLCAPVVHFKKVIPILKWLIEEMERRFDILHQAKKRDILSYNKFIEQTKKKGEETEFEKLPYIVLIIDELADIMMAKGKEFESLVVRLAQMSRAVGIHLVLATQRPSVEVLTGLIKANITSRIAFQLPTQVDSRTILDVAGAERLLGRGDMLFLSSEFTKPRRFQGPFVSSEEIKRVVDYIKKTEKKEPQEIEERLEENLEKIPESELSGIEETDDELYEEAKRIAIQARKASASLFQRRLKIGYARAARLLDMLEERGIVGPGQGSKPREVYIKESDNPQSTTHT